jgi:imidazolonepropionase-like amidohydrolase
MKKISFSLLLFLFILQTKAQEYFPVNESVKNKSEIPMAFTNATIQISPTKQISNATLVIQNGKIIAIGENVTLPKNAIVTSLKGKYIYPSFIDMYTSFGVSKPKSASGSTIYDTQRKGYYWNEHIKSEVNAFENFEYDSKKAEDYLKAGFGIVLSHQADGVARGTGTLVALNNDDDSGKIIQNAISNHFGFTKSVTSKQSYPNSLMGMIALLKQMYLDLDWYKKGNSETTDLSLEALIKNEKLVQIFETEDKLNSLRAAKLAKEFNLNYLLKGSGNEFERIDEIKQANVKFIIPINFPEAYDVSNIYLANQIDLADLRFWNQAPTNLKVLSDNNVSFALTTDNLKKISDFKNNLLKAIKYGFTEEKALAALTTIPAEFLGKTKDLGTIEVGKMANFLITSDKIFEEKNIVYENWVQGTKYVITDKEIIDIRGDYKLIIGTENLDLKITGTTKEPKAEIKSETKKKLISKLKLNDNWLSIAVTSTDTIKPTITRLTAYVENANKIKGKAILFDGKEFNWTAEKIKEFTGKKDSTKTTELNKLVKVTYPNLPYGYSEKPKVQTILFKNATVWTNEKDGISVETDVLVKNGKIASIGKNLKDTAALQINATGKHLTAGIIDEHSHIAISRGVNESGHNSTAEVSIQDVVNSEDIDIYRELAGGVTTSQLLHGSANPIGGQSAIVKWKWSASPEEMLYKNQPKFIKFALGENVKQSGSSNNNPTRFPQTRMGVEQVFIDYFQRAKEYKQEWKNYQANSKRKKAPRTDLELQTLAEIIDKERFISCHSYVASEILMMMQVAEKFDFRMNTFTHILEGYKVADEMKKHGVGASTFSDWWAYKFEVNDAIPYNGPIMHNAGLVVAYNSDNAEMSRRLNQEAAKAVKYGNVSEEDAWKFVTLNPAKLLHIDDKVGSIAVGKDADLVLWNTNPLSIYAKAEKTIIEGIIYYDIDKKQVSEDKITEERNELIAQMLQEKNKGMTTQSPKKKEKVEYHCDTLEEN